MVSGRVSAPPELHRVIAITRCLPCGLLGHTHTRGYGIPVGIICVDSIVNKDSLLYYEYTIDVHLFSFGS